MVKTPKVQGDGEQNNKTKDPPLNASFKCKFGRLPFTRQSL